MSDFKFVCREEELEFAQEALSRKKFIIYYYYNDSGISYYLKKLSLLLNTDSEVCFYIDCIRNQNIAIQIATQIISSVDKNKLSKYTKDSGLVFKKVIESLTTSIDVIPFLNVGELFAGLTVAINDTLDADIEHLSDYKIEKAIVNMLNQITHKNKINNIYILLDDASSIKSESLEFLAKIMDFSIIKILVTIPNNSLNSGIENLSKISISDIKPYEIEKIFDRPNDKMIKGLFMCYEQEYNEQYLNVFKRYERNIHIIMSYIHGFHMGFMHLDKESITVLKILLILNTYIDINALKMIYMRINLFRPNSDILFNEITNKLKSQRFIAFDSAKNVHLNSNIINDININLSLIEQLSISRDIIDIFETCKQNLTIPQLKFSIRNLDKDYNRRKSYILLLLDKQKEMM